MTAAMPGFTFTSVGIAGTPDLDEVEAAAANETADAANDAASTTKHTIPPSRRTPPYFRRIRCTCQAAWLSSSESVHLRRVMEKLKRTGPN